MVPTAQIHRIARRDRPNFAEREPGAARGVLPTDGDEGILDLALHIVLNSTPVTASGDGATQMGDALGITARSSQSIGGVNRFEQLREGSDRQTGHIHSPRRFVRAS